MKLTLPLAAASLAALTACGSPSGPSLVSQFEDGKLTGSYRQSEMNTDTAKGLVAFACPRGKLATYSETAPDKYGKIAYTATCKAG